MLEDRIQSELKRLCSKDIEQASDQELFLALVNVAKEKSQEIGYNQGNKKLYYISAEFLIGKILSNNLINLGMYENVKLILEHHGRSLEALEEVEDEPSLGSGGLGRLAACFLDSIAALGLPGDGIGLNYHFGLFHQVFEAYQQKELPDPWIGTNSWLCKAGDSFEVPFKDFKLKSVLYDMDVTGYDSRCNKLHLFDVETLDESIVEEGIAFDKNKIKENLTLFLYPDDSTREGQLLRIYQQYFMVSNGAQYILCECKRKGYDLKRLHDHVVIQINDTHPSLVIPELIRLLQQEGITFQNAVDIVKNVCAYTNHTILSEALEIWPAAYLEEVVPHLMPIIQKLDEMVREKYQNPSIYIIDNENRVHMAHMDIHYGFSVNGVAALHTDILKTTELKPFYDIYPEKFNNKTNGITVRRWLLHCNPRLTDFIESLIGNGFKKDAQELEKLKEYAEDQNVLTKIGKIKHANKVDLKNFLLKEQGIEIDEYSIFDIQIKRLLEYKRQQMNALYIIYKYLEIKKGNHKTPPLTMIFGAKAAPNYTIAKDILHLILCLQKLIQDDPQVKPYLNVVVVENYNVTAASRLFPACDISEQISLASKEASGTGNMKFMLNGAVTLGTMDGANVEIYDLVSEENIYIFGQSSDDVIHLYKNAGYRALKLYMGSAEIKQWVDFIVSEELTSIGNYESLKRLHEYLIHKDWFMTLLDVKDYITTKERMLEDYIDRTAWNKKALRNICEAGFFSSDRTIKQYNDNIWHL